MREAGRRRPVLALVIAVLTSATALLVAMATEPEESVASTPAAMVGERLPAVEDWAASRQARVSLAFVDRATGARVGLREDQQVLTASVAKLFIASQLAFLDVTGERVATSEDDALLGAMLSASDDGAATVLWDALGGPDLVGAVAGRYGLSGTAAPVDGLWWHTSTTASDIAQFYDQLLDERSAVVLRALPGIRPEPNWADRILGYLGQWTAVGADGYDQSFGLAAAFGTGSVGDGSVGSLSALKQGWMCCVDAQWIHLTTGTFGPGSRYILVVQVAEDVQYTDGTAELPDTPLEIAADDESARHARDTVSGVVSALIPEGMLDGDARS